MDKWTGKLDLEAHDAIKQLLASTQPGLEEGLEKVRARHWHNLVMTG